MASYNPIQLNDYVHYQEIVPCPALKEKVVCFWELKALKEDIEYFVIPDGCVDIVVNCGKEKEVYLSPTLIKPNTFQLFAKETWFGIRLYPAMASQLFSIHLVELKQKAIDVGSLNQVWSRHLEEQLAEAADFEEKTKIATEFLIRFLIAHSSCFDSRLEGFIQAIYYTHGNISMAEANKYFISSRQLRRLFNQHIGVSPKKFARIVRSQYFLNVMKANHSTHSIYDAYFDQAHFIKEIKEMTGLTPKQLMNKFKSLQ